MRNSAETARWRRSVGEVIRRGEQVERLVDGRGQRPGGGRFYSGHVGGIFIVSGTGGPPQSGADATPVSLAPSGLGE